MGKNASAALGGAEVAATLVSPRGLTKKMTLRTAGGQIGGMAGDLAASGIADGTKAGAPDVPNFGRMGYLAASETDLVVTKTSQLGLKPYPIGDALVRVSLREVESASLVRRKLLSQLTLSFVNGVIWEFEVPRAHRKSAEQFVTALGGSVS